MPEHTLRKKKSQNKERQEKLSRTDLDEFAKIVMSGKISSKKKQQRVFYF